MDKKIIPPNTIRKNLSLPRFTLLHGYIVHLHDTDEFLHHENFPALFWCKEPWSSYIFQSRGKAEKFIANNKPSAIVCYLFESDDGFIVAKVYED